MRDRKCNVSLTARRTRAYAIVYMALTLYLAWFKKLMSPEAASGHTRASTCVLATCLLVLGFVTKPMSPEATFGHTRAVAGTHEGIRQCPGEFPILRCGFFGAKIDMCASINRSCGLIFQTTWVPKPIKSQDFKCAPLYASHSVCACVHVSRTMA